MSGKNKSKKNNNNKSNTTTTVAEPKKATLNQAADVAQHSWESQPATGEFNRAGEQEAPVHGERVTEYRGKIEQQHVEVDQEAMVSEQVMVRRQKLALQPDGDAEKVASFRTPAEPKKTASGHHTTRHKVEDKIEVKHVGRTEKLADVVKTDGVTGERVQVFAKPIVKEHTEVWVEDFEQEHVRVEMQPLAMKPVGEAVVTEKLETDDMVIGPKRVAVSNTTTTKVEPMHKTMDVMTTEDETGHQHLIRDPQQTKQILTAEQRTKQLEAERKAEYKKAQVEREYEEKKNVVKSKLVAAEQKIERALTTETLLVTTAAVAIGGLVAYNLFKRG